MIVDELRKILAEIPKRFENGITVDYDAPNETAITKATRILDQMHIQHIDASYITFTADGGIVIIWHSEITPGRYAHLECDNDGAVTGCRCNRYLEIKYPDFCFWWVSDVTNQTPMEENGDKSLRLNLVEALEHIRCYIFADHN